MPDANFPRILCVDDNPDVADSTADLLSLFGFNTRACYDGLSALYQAELFKPHICLIDLNMPGIDGAELAVRLRQASHPLALVAVTAMNDEFARKRILSAGFDIHLVKPVEPRTLVNTITALWRTGNNS